MLFGLYPFTLLKVKGMQLISPHFLSVQHNSIHFISLVSFMSCIFDFIRFLPCVSAPILREISFNASVSFPFLAFRCYRFPFPFPFVCYGFLTFQFSFLHFMRFHFVPGCQYICLGSTVGPRKGQVFPKPCYVPKGPRRGMEGERDRKMKGNGWEEKG